MAYIGNTVENQGFTPAIDYFNGNGVTVTFTLSRPIASVAQVIVAVDNVIQNPSSAFNVVGNSITFTSAPLSGTNNIWVEYTSLITTYQGISQDPTVIGDIRATGGYLAEGDFGNSFVAGAIVDYVTGLGRVTVGPAEGIALYNGGTASRTERMRIDSSGNVGIGTSSPSQKLDVAGDTRVSNSTGNKRFYIGQATPSANDGGSLEFQNSSTQINWAIRTNFNVAGALEFCPSSAAGGVSYTTPSMIVTNAGNVGINNTSPAVLASTTQVAIKANASADSMFVAQNSNGLTTAKFGFQFTGGVDNPVIGSFTNHPFLFLTNNTERMRITSGGNLYIGTTQNYGNGHKVEIRFTGGTTEYGLGLEADSLSTGTQWLEFTSGGGTIRGSIDWSGSAVRYNTSSDYRLKENITPMVGALDKVSQLKPSTYVWKEDGSVGQGFIAHELAEVIPEAVSGEKDAVETYTDENGNEQTRIKPQGIDTSFLVATLTAAIQELKAEVDSLKAQLEAK